jgi:hypothetical protein
MVAHSADVPARVLHGHGTRGAPTVLALATFFRAGGRQERVRHPLKTRSLQSTRWMRDKVQGIRQFQRGDHFGCAGVVRLGCSTLKRDRCEPGAASNLAAD